MRKVDDLVQALSLSGIEKSTVSRTCQELDATVSAFRIRPLSSIYPYVWFDALVYMDLPLTPALGDP